MAKFFGYLLLLGAVGAFWPWVVSALLIAGVICWGIPALVRYVDRLEAAEAQRQEELRALVRRCDQQHAWTLSGDPRGTFGTT